MGTILLCVFVGRDLCFGCNVNLRMDYYFYLTIFTTGELWAVIWLFFIFFWGGGGGGGGGVGVVVWGIFFVVVFLVFGKTTT